MIIYGLRDVLEEYVYIVRIDNKCIIYRMNGRGCNEIESDFFTVSGKFMSMIELVIAFSNYNILYFKL